MTQGVVWPHSSRAALPQGRLYCGGGKRFLSVFPCSGYGYEHLGVRMTPPAGRCLTVIWCHPSPGTGGSGARAWQGTSLSFLLLPAASSRDSYQFKEKGRKGKVSVQHKSFCNKR